MTNYLSSPNSGYKYVVVVLSCLLLLSSCIVTVPKRGATDLSENYPFESMESTYNYIPTNAKEALTLIRKEDSCIVTIFAPWCPHSYSAIDNDIYLKHNISTHKIFICTNYDIKNIEKHFTGKIPSNTIYFIDAKTYGSIESKKTKAFISDLTNKSEDSVSSGVPQHLLFYKGQLIKESRDFKSIKQSL